MNLLNVKTFLYIVQYQSISGAAQAMFTSQPTISARLSQLEEELGFQLVKRNKGQRAIELTAKGQSFISLAERWLELDKQTMQFRVESDRERIILAAPSSLQEHVLPSVVQKLLDEENPPHIQLRTAGSDLVYSLVASQDADAGLVLRLRQIDGTIAIPVFSEEKVLICPANTLLPDEEIHPEQLDPGFEVNVSSWTGETRRWHDHYWDPYTPPYLQVDNNHITHNYLTHPKSWAVCHASVATSIVRRRPGEIVIRRLNPAPPKHICYLVTTRSQLKNKSALIHDLQAKILQYAEEVPWLQPIYND